MNSSSKDSPHLQMTSAPTLILQNIELPSLASRFISPKLKKNHLKKK